MKKLLPLLFLLIYSSFSAQLDREHWFAPMVDRVGSGFQYIYMSTGETTPFRVDIYNNNQVVGSVTISKNNPQRFTVGRPYIITTSQSELFTPVAKGLYLKGEKPFFASLRFSVTNHAEIQTSKGTAGLGTEFRAVMAPITVSNTILNFMTSVMATEDNTTVTVNEFNPNTVFSDNIPRTQIIFTLNKGQSYIIDGRGDEFQNYTGFIGAKIAATKPVIIANGNFNGQYAGNYPSASDILMDQGVPVDKLGKTFVLVKGNGANSFNSGTETMEKAIVVAVKDGTQIYLNGASAPAVTLNAGQYYETPPDSYIHQGDNHYNMYLSSSEDIYVYQLLAGVESASSTSNLNGEATGGFNYIPPLSCYLPKKIDEIGKIDENYFKSNSNPSGILNIPTKLNIITERGATLDVKRNGTSLVLSALNDPFDVSGNPNWVTYSVPGISGNISIFSSKAVTAGISAGDDAVGYGGYFAGFSSIPLITKTEGDCLPGVKLEVTAGFDSYEWLLKNPDGSYSPAPGINNIFKYEPQQAGIYAVKVKQGSCSELQTQDFKFYNCTTYTNTNYDSCGTEVITSAFSLSSQTVNPTTVTLITPPTKGTVTIVNGIITYTANPGASGADTFKYTFCGTGAIPDCETAQATIRMIEKRDDAILQECSANGIAVYDLSLANVTPDNTLAKSYFTTEAGAQNNIAAQQILNFTSYTSADTFVYVRLTNSLGCVSVAKIQLKAKRTPEVKPELYTKLHCDEDVDFKLDGIYKVDLTTVTPSVLVQALDFIVRYYDDQSKAVAGLNNHITGIFGFTADTSVWIRVDAPNGCPTAIKEIQLKTGTTATLTTLVASKVVCDAGLDGSEAVNLQDYVSLFISATNSTMFFSTLSDAQNNVNAISANQIIMGDQPFYYRISVAGFCATVGTLNLQFLSGTPSGSLPASVTVCEGSTTILNVGGGYNAINWSTGESTATITAGAGNYWVELTNASGCVYRQNVTVLDSPKPIWTIAAYSAVHCDEDFDGDIEIDFSTVTPVVLQNSNLFTVEYFADKTYTTPLPENWSYSEDTTIYVRALSSYCPTEIRQIDFKVGPALALNSYTAATPVCDNDLSGSETVDLSDYSSLFTTATGVSVTYFNNLNDAEKNIAGTDIPAAQTIAGNKAFYYRFSKAGVCDEIGVLNITFKQPKKSAGLVSKQICPETTTTLNAGSGFDSYLWSTGDTSASVRVPVGEYWVDLASNGCVYRQTVSVTAFALPEIVSVEIAGSTVTVNVTGGNPPYQYAIDNFKYQSSNVFTNVSGGDHTVYVISADNCKPVSAEFNVIQRFNVITPNGDGKNDTLDYSGLMKKTEPFFVVFDRQGQTVFTGSAGNRFIWDGKLSGRTLKSGSYWYVMRWTEPGFTTVTEYSGWILVKNRN